MPNTHRTDQPAGPGLSKEAEDRLRDLKDAAERKAAGVIRKTAQLQFYLLKFAFRIAIFLSVFILYLTHRAALIHFMQEPFFGKISPFHFLWALFMALMIIHLIPSNRLTMAIRKAQSRTYQPAEYEELALLRHVQQMNIGAWKVLLVWLSFNAIFAALYLADVIQAGDLLMLTVFYYLCDYICILIYCPFQTLLMKNKCCVNCRIYDWGHFMMFTPMLFIKNFFSWSLFFTSLVVMIHWEIVYARHPERFWEGSNATLRCASCKDETCQLKRRLAAAAHRQ